MISHESTETVLAEPPALDQMKPNRYYEIACAFMDPIIAMRSSEKMILIPCVAMAWMPSVGCS